MRHQVSTHNYYFFSLAADYQECEKLYRGPGVNIVLTAESGHRVQVPCHSLRPFVTSSGIRGRFRLTVNEANKLVRFEKIS
ncbi:DUF2835 domain-containing protein [Salinimonas sp. HHU 13199]|uniref:DUF2835 domain-containing protein n=1 Tax=Salinimonas profundi TaxID=2729140 RepID=A0ABR8LJK9_9ALTE|nr:DUF2835 domain-containing protein [Salinimonas profundi]